LFQCAFFYNQDFSPMARSFFQKINAVFRKVFIFTILIFYKMKSQMVAIVLK
jgi:hypothetical protein